MMGIDGLLVPIRCATSNRPKRRCLALVAVLVLGGVATGNRAEDLGTVGETYAIAEPHLLSYIEQTLREKEKSGELANLEELPQECGCLVLLRNAIAANTPAMIDLTPALKRKVGL